MTEKDVNDLAPADKESFDDIMRLENEKEKNDPPPKDEPEDTDDTPEDDEKADDTSKDDKKEEEEEEESEPDASVENEIANRLGGYDEDEEEDDGFESNIDFGEDTVLSENTQRAFSKLEQEIDIDDQTISEFGGLLEQATKEGSEFVIESFREEQAGRRESMMADPLMSKKNIKETQKNMEAAVNKFGGKHTKGLRQFLGSWYSYDPSLVNFLNNIGSALNETPELGGNTVANPSKKSSGDSALEKAKQENSILFE